MMFNSCITNISYIFSGLANPSITNGCVRHSQQQQLHQQPSRPSNRYAYILAQNFTTRGAQCVPEFSNPKQKVHGLFQFYIAGKYETIQNQLKKPSVIRLPKQ